MASSPATMRSSVDLPQPDGPTRTHRFPSGIVKLTSRTATTPPAYVLLTSRSATSATLPPSLLRLDQSLEAQRLCSALTHRPRGRSARIVLPKKRCHSGVSSAARHPLNAHHD